MKNKAIPVARYINILELQNKLHVKEQYPNKH
jgi:hypothetical protein